jgi:hypothetical protein
MKKEAIIHIRTTKDRKSGLKKKAKQDKTTATSLIEKGIDLVLGER